MVEEKKSAWVLESGLVDDVDAWIANPKFGTKEEYAEAVVAGGSNTAPLMFLVDLVDENGEIIANQGWSIGSGWEVSEDGKTITHPKRQNVVHSTMYGALQYKVVQDIGVDMDKYGKPTDADSWDGLGFHWNLTPHKTVSGKEVSSLMPTIFLGKAGASGSKPAPKKSEPSEQSEAMKKALELVAESNNAKEFQLKAMKVPAIVADDTLMSQCLDDGPEGFYAQNKQ